MVISSPSIKLDPVVEVGASAISPWYFMVRHGRILEPPPGRGVIEFEPWPHLKELVKRLLIDKLLLLGKARQGGASWTAALFALWTALYKEGANVLMLSKGQTEAQELLAKARFCWSQLPDFMKPVLGQDQTTLITLPSMRSKIRALPATEDAGVGETATLVICDEWDLHPYAEANYTAVKPTIDAGGQFIGMSAFYKENMESFFKRMWREGHGFEKIFWPWTVRPGRDERWYQETKKTYPNIDLFLGQYPLTEEEALAPPREMTFFDGEALLRMDIREVRDGVIRPKQTGHRYCAGLDPSGEGPDNHSLHILDANTGEVVVACAQSGPVEVFAQQAVNLLSFYGNPLLGLEDNGVGLAMKKILEALGYSNFYYADKTLKRMWVTNSQSRPMILLELAQAVREGAVLVNCKETIREMLEFTREMKAPEGRHDDRVFSLSIAWQMRKYTPSNTGIHVIGGLVRR